MLKSHYPCDLKKHIKTMLLFSHFTMQKKKTKNIQLILRIVFNFVKCKFHIMLNAFKLCNFFRLRKKHTLAAKSTIIQQ